MDETTGAPIDGAAPESAAPDFDFDGAANDFISQLETEIADEDLNALPDAADVDAGVDAAGTDAPAADEAPSDEALPADGEVAPKEGKEDRSLERLVAREVAVREKEARYAEFDAREQKYQARIAELEATTSKVPTEFIDSLHTSPTEALKAAGHDPDNLVRLIIAEKMIAAGKQVDPALERSIEKAQSRRQMETMQRKIETFQRQQIEAAFVANVEHGARQYVSNPELSKHAPTLATVAKANPERVHAEIMDEIRRDAAARVGKEPNGNVLPYAEAAKRIEKRWTEFRTLLGVAPTNASTTAGESKEQKPANTGASVKTPKATQPPAKPLSTQKKEKTWEELQDDGIKAAMAEFKRAEMAKRRPANS